MRPRQQHAAKPRTKSDARNDLTLLLGYTSEKALHTFLTVESLVRTTGLPEQEVRVKLNEARERRPYP